MISNLIDRTQVTLGIAGTWDGRAFPVDDAATILVVCYSDKNGTLYIDQRSDGTDWDIVKTIAYTALDKKGYSVEVRGNEARVRYLNGAVAQGVFRLDVLKKKEDDPSGIVEEYYNLLDADLDEILHRMGDTGEAAGFTTLFSWFAAILAAIGGVLPAAAKYRADISLAAIDNALTTDPSVGAPDVVNTILDLPITALINFELEDLVLKVSSYGTGSQITIQCWELLNGVIRANYVNTHTVVIPLDFAMDIYLGITELFGKSRVLGRGIAITAITDAGNTGALKCSYTYSKASI